MDGQRHRMQICSRTRSGHGPSLWPPEATMPVPQENKTVASAAPEIGKISRENPKNPAALRLTDAMARSPPAPTSGNRVTYERGKDGVKGFGIRVTASEAKSFVLNYTVGGRERRITIGGHPRGPSGALRLPG